VAVEGEGEISGMVKEASLRKNSGMLVRVCRTLTSTKVRSILTNSLYNLASSLLSPLSPSRVLLLVRCNFRFINMARTTISISRRTDRGSWLRWVLGQGILRVGKGRMRPNPRNQRRLIKLMGNI
jgi:hypothetical protein